MQSAVAACLQGKSNLYIDHCEGYRVTYMWSNPAMKLRREKKDLRKY